MDMPIARTSDPESSHLAAARVTNSGKRQAQQERCLAGIAKHRGSTSAELAHKLGEDRFMTARRLPELEHVGKVRRSALAVCSVTGSKCLTWWPV